jgi:hypothetical protein
VIPIMPFRTTHLLSPLAIALAACTTLGPVAGTTAIAPVEAGRTTVEVSAGGVPGFNLSQATQEEVKGAPIKQLAAVLEPAAMLGVPGLVLGGRALGTSGDVQVEPMIGYRRSFGADGNVSGMAVVHGTHASASKNGASYEATRIGGELAADYRVFGAQPWIEPHVFATVSASHVSADGEYCADANGYGRDCDSPDTTIDGHVSGVYPMATAGVALHGIAHRESWFHGARAAAMIGAGAMPRVIDGESERMQAYLTFGIMVSVAVGAAK